MTLARAWRRQLLGASGAALIVPAAMLAALVALALGGAFSQVGVLGQLFAGPSLPGVANGSSGGVVTGARSGARAVAAAGLPVVPAVTPRAATPRRPVAQPAPRGRPVLTAGRGTSSAGGALGGTGGTVRPVTSGGTGSSTGTGSGAGTGSGPGTGSGGGSPAGSSPPPTSPAPSPQPSPPPAQPTPVDTAVKVVTSVTQQLPAPVGPVATQTVQAAGTAVDNLLPQTGQP